MQNRSWISNLGQIEDSERSRLPVTSCVRRVQHRERPLSKHPDMAVVAQHTSGHVTRDLHDCLVACSTLASSVIKVCRYRATGRYLCISAHVFQAVLSVVT